MPARRILPIYLAIIALLVAGLWKLYPLRQIREALTGPTPAISSRKPLAFRTPFEAAFAGEQRFKLVKVLNLDGVIAVIGQRQGGEAHVDNGDTSIRYVRRNGEHYKLVPGARMSTQTGSYGNPGDISIRRDLSGRPMVILTSRDGNAGCYETWNSLIELDGEGPHDMIFFTSEVQDERDLHAGPDDWGFTSTLHRTGPDILLSYNGDVQMKVELKRDGDRFKSNKNFPRGCY